MQNMLFIFVEKKMLSEPWQLKKTSYHEFDPADPFPHYDIVKWYVMRERVSHLVPCLLAAV